MSAMLSGITIGSILLGAALVLIVVLLLARPFAMPEDEERRIGRETVDGLVLRKESLLRDIRELDDDYEAAKVAPELYMSMRPQMVKQAAVLMKRLDDLGYADPAEPVAAAAPSVDAQIEAAVRRLRTPEQIDEAIEAAVRRTRSREERATAAPGDAVRFCPQCGRRAAADDRFCPNCGHNLAQENKAAQAARA